MSAASSTMAGRVAAEALMVDVFTAYAPSTTTPDPDGFISTAMTPQGQTFGKVQATSQRGGDTNTRLVQIGNVSHPVIEGGLHIPLSATIPAVGWEYVCTAIGSTSDTSLLNRRWRVVDVPAKSFATARRLDVVEVPL